MHFCIDFNRYSSINKKKKKKSKENNKLSRRRKILISWQAGVTVWAHV